MSLRHEDIHRLSKAKRILVVGTSGSGKSTFARALSKKLNIPWVQLDSIYHQPGWVPLTPEEFRLRLSDIAKQPSWICDGNYNQFSNDTLWPRSEIVVWLDLPLLTILRRITLRTLRRLIQKEELWNGNRESWKLFFSSENMILWVLRTYRKNKALYRNAAKKYKVIIVRNEGEAEGVLRGLNQ